MSKVIEIESFNPFENSFPNRKLVSKGTLQLIKHLRQNGYEVVVLPKNDQPVEYLFKKGIIELFSDPVFAFIIGLPTGLIINIISNYVQKAIDGKCSKEKSIVINNKFYIEARKENRIYNLNKKIKQRSERQDKKTQQEKLKKEFAKCLSLKSPFKNLPTPIFLEHKPRVVGWCILDFNDKGIHIEDSRILDKNVFRKIEKGKLKGGSLMGIAEESICSICNSNYIECNHITGEYYDSKECINAIKKAIPIEISLVKAPVNPECLVNIVQQNSG